MTPEQKQRVEEIRSGENYWCSECGLVYRTTTVDPHNRHPDCNYSAVKLGKNPDVDYLLSVLDAESERADAADAECERLAEAHRRYAMVFGDKDNPVEAFLARDLRKGAKNEQ